MARKANSVTFVNLDQQNFGNARNRAIINNHILRHTKAGRESRGKNNFRLFNSLSSTSGSYALYSPDSGTLETLSHGNASSSPNSLRRSSHPRSQSPAADTREVDEDEIRNSSVASARYSFTLSKISTCLNTSLDPFLSFSVEVSKAEALAIHTYILRTPRRVYGMRPDSAFDTFRNHSIPFFHLYPMVAEWQVIEALQQAAFSQQQPVPDVVLRRKSKAYTKLNKALMNPDKITDEVFAAVCFASLFEGRSIGPEVSKLHVMGLEALLKHVGGLYGVAFAARGVLAISCLEGVVTDGQENIAISVSRKLASVAKHNGDLLGYINRAETEVSDAAGWTSMKMVASRNLVLSLSELMSNEVTAPLLQIPIQRLSAPVMRTRFVLLYGLNLLIQDFGNNLDLGCDVLRSILRHALDSTAFDEEGRPLLRAIGLLWMFAAAVTDNYGGSEITRPEDKVVWWCAECIDGLKVFSSVSALKQLKLLKLLHEWLSTLVSSTKRTIESSN